ncbi:MAG TPA: hypothetical protein PLF40_25790, partial [Kofleriaceae bacterium]|nr:hypothetical protein [Kofleriaceae bacterium]
LAPATANAIDRLSRAPLPTHWRRLAAMLALDVWAVLGGAILLSLVLLFALRWWLALPATLAVGVAARLLLHQFARAHVASQLPMRRVPERIASLVDAPYVVFGHTHDPLQMRMPSGATYINCGTWLPAARPGLRRCFTHVRIVPPSQPGAAPRAAILQWHNGAVRTFESAS